jgi:hypothetical protein
MHSSVWCILLTRVHSLSYRCRVHACFKATSHSVVLVRHRRHTVVHSFVTPKSRSLLHARILPLPMPITWCVHARRCDVMRCDALTCDRMNESKASELAVQTSSAKTTRTVPNQPRNANRTLAQSCADLALADRNESTSRRTSAAVHRRLTLECAGAADAKTECPAGLI